MVDPGGGGAVLLLRHVTTGADDSAIDRQFLMLACEATDD